MVGIPRAEFHPIRSPTPVAVVKRVPRIAAVAGDTQLVGIGRLGTDDERLVFRPVPLTVSSLNLKQTG